MIQMTWTKEEFKTYVLIYVAHCNYIETKEESDYIVYQINEDLYNMMHTEIVLDNEDRVKLDKIQDYLRENNYTESDKKALLKDVKNVIFADGTVDNLEKKVYSLLKKILH